MPRSCIDGQRLQEFIAWKGFLKNYSFLIAYWKINFRINPMKIAFIHPDLGIGGAERWLVDSALALESLKHEVRIFTSYYNPDRCFDETKQMKVIKRGDFLPRSVFGACYALCAYLRMIYLAFYMILCSDFSPDVIICDQISACIPVLKMKRSKIIFYCHFPDLLLTKRASLLKSLYRKPIDLIEEYTTGLSDQILVNSQFTLNIFRETFKSLSYRDVKVLHPSLNISKFDSIQPDPSSLKFYDSSKKYILSLNRYERKKNIGLAIEALAELKCSDDSWISDVKLIIAGGYDDRVSENVQHFAELRDLVDERDLIDDVIFLKSPSDVEKITLLAIANVLVYTPSDEHFGIVPVEAMYMKTPVVAVNSGGPLETVADDVTGYLCDPIPSDFSTAIVKILTTSDEKMSEIKENCKIRVIDLFSFDAFTTKLNFFVNL